MTTIQPGPHLDALICESLKIPGREVPTVALHPDGFYAVCEIAIELRVRQGKEDEPQHAVEFPNAAVIFCPTIGFRPSTSWEDAMWAADRFDLLGVWTTLGRDELGEEWCIYEQDGASKHTLAKGETGPLAISRAILMRSI